MDVLDNKVWIWIIVAMGWALNAWWTRRQDRLADEQRRRNPSPTPRASASARAPKSSTTDDRSYAEIQQEIRRKIAERWQTANNSRPPLSTPPPMRQPPRPPVTVAVTRNVVPDVMVSVTPVLHQELPPASAPLAPLAPTYGASLSAGVSHVAETAAVLQSVLSDSSAARQAFLFREIFDRPLCLRPAGHGGHDGW